MIEKADWERPTACVRTDSGMCKTHDCWLWIDDKTCGLARIAALEAELSTARGIHRLDDAAIALLKQERDRLEAELALTEEAYQAVRNLCDKTEMERDAAQAALEREKLAETEVELKLEKARAEAERVRAALAWYDGTGHQQLRRALEYWHVSRHSNTIPFDGCAEWPCDTTNAFAPPLAETGHHDAETALRKESKPGLGVPPPVESGGREGETSPGEPPSGAAKAAAWLPGDCSCETLPAPGERHDYGCPSAETGKCEECGGDLDKPGALTGEDFCHFIADPPSGAAKAVVRKESGMGLEANAAPDPPTQPPAAVKPDGDEACPLPPRVAHDRHWWERDDGLQVWCPGRPPRRAR